MQVYFSGHNHISRVFSINYRLSPQCEYPCAIIDAISAYVFLLEKGIPASRLVFCGDSCGGGLAFAACLAIRDAQFEGVPLPSGIVALSPWLDLSSSTASFAAAGQTDFLPYKATDPHLEKDRRTHYCPNKELWNSYVSPLFAKSLQGLPPSLIQTGEIERLREEASIFSFRAVMTPYVFSPANEVCQRKDTTRIQLETYQDHVHVFQQFVSLEAGKKGIYQSSN